MGERTGSDEEIHTSIEWHKPEELHQLYVDQASKTTRPELDESEIIKRFIDAYQL